jgi:hypothetical protein
VYLRTQADVICVTGSAAVAVVCGRRRLFAVFQGRLRSRRLLLAGMDSLGFSGLRRAVRYGVVCREFGALGLPGLRLLCLFGWPRGIR